MDYPTSSRRQKKPSPTGSDSSSKYSSPTTTESASGGYFTALANSSTPYESPYTQGRDKRPQPPTTLTLRASTTSNTTRSQRVDPSYQPTSPPVRGSLSTYSSSSGGSLYTSSPSREQQRGTTPGSMSSSSKAMSSVSAFYPFVSRQTLNVELRCYAVRVVSYISGNGFFHHRDGFTRGFQINYAAVAPSPLASVRRCAALDAIATSAEPALSTLKSITNLMLLKTHKEQLIRSLRTHRVNTLTELRRIEKLFASNTAADVTEAMTSAWAHYVNSNNLLSELRGMTKNYPFSSECLDEAKWQVIGDPASTRSWNYCWLILTKIKNE